VGGWTPRPEPSLPSRRGRFIEIERFDAKAHGEALHRAIDGPKHAQLWEFIPFGPFDDSEALSGGFSAMNTDGDWTTYVFRTPGERELLGTASLMAVRPGQGVAEVGCVIYGPALQRTSAATELQYLLASHVFDDLGYRRYEWKCDARNAASRRAAQRLGFTFEGVFRQHMVVRGINRDTAWFSMTDGEWPAIREAFERWLAPANIAGGGSPHQRLSELRGQSARR